MSPKREDDSGQADLARRLRETREYLNLSQQFVAAETGLARSAISDIERGVRRVDSLELQRLARVYRYPVSYFLGDDDEVAGADSDNIRALARAAGELTDGDVAEVLRFATFLRHYNRAEQEQRG